MNSRDGALLSYVSPKATVRPSRIHGRGLFAVEGIAKGELVAIKGGYVFERATLAEVERQRRSFIGTLYYLHFKRYCQMLWMG